MRQRLTLLFLVMVVLMTMGCTGSDKGTGNSREPQASDTLYTQQAAMSIYGYQPERALQIIDSAIIVGNLNEVWADVNRARIYSQSQMAEQLDSLLGGPKGVRLDTARAIGERLLLHDSLKTNPKLRQDVLEMLIYTARQQEDSVRWLQRSRELVEECRKHGAETKALRTEAELGSSLCYSGQQEQGIAMLDSVIAAIGSLEPFRFYELDAFIIAAKRKIGVLSTLGREEETLPLARRIIELLDDYEQHPDQYHDGSYREPQNDTKRSDYIRFYRTQAQGFITAAYTTLGDKGNMTEAYEKIEKAVRDVTAREHLARYSALQQQMEAEHQRANAQRSQLVTVIFAILLVSALVALVWYWRQKRIISRKNHALVRQIDEAMEYRDKYEELKLQTPPLTPPLEGRGVPAESMSLDGREVPADDVAAEEVTTPLSSRRGAGGEASLFTQIHDAIIREQLYLNPACDRQMLTDRFQLSKERLGTLFAQHSEYNNVSAYINALRLEHASRLLTSQPDMDIQQIAAASGFSSHRYFSTCFKQRFGLSPTDYRRAKAL